MIRTLTLESAWISEFIDGEFLKKANRFLMGVYEGMKEDVVIFADAFLPPDEILRSTIGISSGNVYQSIMNRVRSDHRNMNTEQIWRRSK